MMTQMDILAKNVMGASTRSVNVFDVGGVNPEEAEFDVLYNEEVNFLANLEGGYRTNYLTSGGNQSCNRDVDRPRP
ncbi:hypothetical protein MTR_0030s0260 [Medicago truncatula]|uniref:Uncharacterized protein n=1 Tax=Medicago truncatula TaxID=3880 RepID=G7ZUH1_MEDTR|nr:hypothetical protein MTR_0030s0260 [Medicago truncatula]